GNDADAPVDAGCVADIDRRLHAEQQDEQRTDAQLRHFLGQNFGKRMCAGHRSTSRVGSRAANAVNRPDSRLLVPSPSGKNLPKLTTRSRNRWRLKSVLPESVTRVCLLVSAPRRNASASTPLSEWQGSARGVQGLCREQRAIDPADDDEPRPRPLRCKSKCLDGPTMPLASPEPALHFPTTP